MRLKKAYCLFGTFLLSWICLLYFSFMHQPANQSNIDRSSVDNDILKLQEEIDSQLKNNKHFVWNMHKFAQHHSGNNGNSDGYNDISKKDFVIPVLVFACNRVTVSRCLEQLIQYRPSPDQFPIIVSQDCNSSETQNVIKSFEPQVLYLQQPDQSEIDIPAKEKKFKGYFKIARHYGWALNQTFYNFNFESAIVVEDDLDIAPDFFEYFLGTYPLLLKDPTLWCISAWNDNGKLGLIDESKPERLYRTDFFPGLGWLLTKKLWQELSRKWPRSYWDDWIRQPEQRKERSCVRPEISRTRTFGKIGVSNGLFFEKHLKFIKLNEEFVPFTKMNLTYLIKANYDQEFVKSVYQCKVVSYQDLKENKLFYNGPVRLVYYSRESFKRIAKMLGLMDDFRSGVPRTAYRGIISFSLKKRMVYLAPNINWKGYDVKWS